MIAHFGKQLKSETLNTSIESLLLFFRWVKYLQLTFVFTIQVSMVLENLPVLAFSLYNKCLPSKEKTYYKYSCPTYLILHMTIIQPPCFGENVNTNSYPPMSVQKHLE